MKAVNLLGKFTRSISRMIPICSLLLVTGCDVLKFEWLGIDFRSGLPPYMQNYSASFKLTAMSDNGVWVAGCTSEFASQSLPFRAKLKRSSNGNLLTKSPYLGIAGQAQLEAFEFLPMPQNSGIVPNSQNGTLCAVGINNDGIAVGNLRSNFSSYTASYLWRDNQVKELTIPPTSTNSNNYPYTPLEYYYSQVVAINNKNLILGIANSFSPSSNSSRLAIWDTTSDFLGFQSSSTTYEFNDDGEYISTSSAQPTLYIDKYGTAVPHEPGRQIDLLGFSGFADDLNRKGTVVGRLGMSSQARFEEMVPFISRKATTGQVSTAQSLTLPVEVAYVYPLKIGSDSSETIASTAIKKDGKTDFVIYSGTSPYLLSKSLVGQAPFFGEGYQSYVTAINDRGEILLSDGYIIRRANLGDFDRNGCIDAQDESALNACRSGTLPASGPYSPSQEALCSIFDFNNDKKIDQSDADRFTSKKSTSVCPVTTTTPNLPPR